ncbi:MAG: PhzF family phenazine biosynthesis protein [Deltaproteobacteria bacterium]|nr:PhzF family phenazine biosynthesis protein [Deltaproteobacteria bacterium]
MTRRPIYKVDAFTQTALQGSPAGVVPLARGLSEDDMLAVARELNAPETAFVLPSRQGDVSLRFFTPTQEVPFSGHALVASLSLLRELGEISTGEGPARVRVETAAGVLPVEIARDGDEYRVDVSQPPPAFQEFKGSTEELLDALGADPSDVREDLPVELSFSGQWHLIVPLESSEALDDLMPDSRRLADLNRHSGAASTYAFVQEAEIFRCRDFAPATGVDEELVNGSSSGALGAYLLRHGIIRPGKAVSFLQGEARGRPGRARVVALGQTGKPTGVVVGGHAVVALRGEVCLPE